MYLFETPVGKKAGVGATVEEAKKGIRDGLLKSEDLLLELEDITLSETMGPYNE